MWHFREKGWKLPCFSAWLLLADGGNLGISQRLSNTLKELSRGYPIAFGHFPAAFLYPLSSAQRLSNNLSEHFSSGYWLKPSNFSQFSFKGRVSVNIYLKSKEHWKICKTTSSSSATTELSNIITFSQSPSHATVPLILISELVWFL